MKKKPLNKIYVIKREVIAASIEEALTKKGIIYSVEESLRPVEDAQPIEFKCK